MPGRRSLVWLTICISVVALLFEACAETSSSAAPGESATALTSGGPTSSSAAPPGIDLVDYEASEDVAAAAHKELDLTHEIRDETGMPALLGKAGAAAFSALDKVEAAYGVTMLEAAASGLADRGRPLAATSGDRRMAAVEQVSDTSRAVTGDVDISIFADTGFTTSAIMGLFADIVSRAAQSSNAELPRNEDHVDRSGGIRQEVNLASRIAVTTGGGRVTVDITMTATDRIFEDATSTFIGLYTSTSTGHFELDGCPDEAGIAAGSYTFETKHELNDVSTVGGATQAGGGRSVKAPFKLIDGDDAHLVRIEASLDMGADARGPGTAGGPGPTGPFDWGATQHVDLVMSAHGGTNGFGGAATVTGTGGTAAAGGSMFISSAMTQLFLGEVGRRAEEFWRSGKCIDLTPSDDTRSVDANEEVSLKVGAKGAFTGTEIKAPITAMFTGVTSLEPAGQPVDEPATFTFKAGGHDGDKGTIDLTQTSKRGIGKRQVVYTVAEDVVQVSVDGSVNVDQADNRYDTTIRLKPTDVKVSEDGADHPRATVTWTTTYTPPAGSCETKTYRGTFETEITAEPDPNDATRVVVKLSFIPGPVNTETIRCQGVSYPFPGSTLLAPWAQLGQPHGVPIGGSTTIRPNLLGLGSSKLTITVKKKPKT